jgi:antibiotic biosynthesis monooxygenase (ABM) superfamily enzyme
MAVDLYVYYKIAASDLERYTAWIERLSSFARPWAKSFTGKRRLSETDPVTCMEVARFDSVDDCTAWQNERTRHFAEIDALIVGGADAIRYEIFTDL